MNARTASKNDYIENESTKVQTRGELRMRGTANCISMRLLVVSR